MSKNHLLNILKTLTILKYLKDIKEIIMILTMSKKLAMIKNNSINNTLVISLIIHKSLAIIN